METINEFFETLKPFAILYIPKAAFAIIVLVIGWWIINRVTSGFAKRMTKLDESLRVFLGNTFNIALKVLLLITAAGMIGIETTSFIAVLGTAGLAVGLALQGTLANFAGGVLILLFRPFKVGDVVETLGKSGAVTSIQIFNTILLTPSGETVILPNGAVSNNPIINYTTFDRSLVEIKLQLAGGTEIERLRAILMPVLQDEPNILPMPLPSIGVADLSPGAVTISIKVFTKPQDAVVVKPSLLEHVSDHLNRHGIKAPVPHSVVHSINDNSLEKR
jgi:small conductance mechanosensitive channel